jgi:hypothetical protein
MLAPMGALVLACVAIGVAPQLAVPFVASALQSFDSGLAASGPRLAELAPLGALAGVAAGLLAAAAVAALLATGFPRARVRRGPTWDCGYAAPAARMQVTASSFADGLLGLLRWALWMQLQGPRVAGPFPKPASLHTHLPDPVLDRAVLPAASRLVRASVWLRWVQHGHVHAYVLYILCAVLVALLVARGALA